DQVSRQLFRRQSIEERGPPLVQLLDRSAARGQRQERPRVNVRVLGRLETREPEPLSAEHVAEDLARPLHRLANRAQACQSLLVAPAVVLEEFPKQILAVHICSLRTK